MVNFCFFFLATTVHLLTSSFQLSRSTIQEGTVSSLLLNLHSTKDGQVYFFILLLLLVVVLFIYLFFAAML